MKALWPVRLRSTSFDDPAVFVSALGAGDDRAIEFLFSKIIRPVEKMAREAGLSRQIAEEVLNDTAVIFIQKIREGSFQLTEAPPHTYALGVARLVIQNYANKERRRRLSPLELETATRSHPDEAAETHFANRENADFLRPLLEKLSEKCRQLIQLRYFDGYSDEESVEQNLTPYTTVNSLKNRRKECLNKLRELAKTFES